MEVLLDKFAEDLGVDPAEMRLRHLVPGNSRTVNHLTVTTNGLGAVSYTHLTLPTTPYV